MNVGVIIFFIMLAVILVFRLPVGIGMLSMGVIYMMITGGNLKIIATGVLNLYYSNYILIAVPLFLFTANVMNSGRITEKIFDFTDGIVGRFRGGLAHVNVLASLIFAGMSGSASADASGLGNMEIAEMRKKGYDPAFSCVVTAASATLSPIFPPSIIMLLYSSLTGAQVGKLFMGGMIPAMGMAGALCLYIALVSKKKKLPYGTTYAIRVFLRFTIQAVPALMTPVILLACIYTGVVTPTEAGALAGVYALVVSALVYRAISPKALFQVLKDTIQGIGMVAITIGCASAIQYISGREKIPALFGSLVLNLASNKYVFLLLVNLLFIFMGMFLETNTITLVFIPIILPLVQAFHIDLVHFGVIFCVNMMIGMISPPYGQLLFVTSAVSGVKVGDIIKEIFPMLVMLFVFLMLLTYCPALVTFIPDLLV